MSKNEVRTKLEHNPYCLWFTGMPNSGKSTLAYYLLQDELRNCVVIDGDRFREHITPELSFSREDIVKNGLSAIKTAKYLMGEGFNVIVAMITPFDEVRLEARKQIRNYYEVWLQCPEPVRSSRPNFRSSDIQYEQPSRSDLVLATDKIPINDCCEQILKLIGR